MRPAQGERGTNVTHSINANDPDRDEYEQGVSLEMSPLFDFSKEPWMLLHIMLNQVVMAHQIIHHTGMEKYAQDITVVDVGAGYGEMYAFLSRARKAGGTHFRYIGIDIDRDKQIVAKQLRPAIDYRIMDARQIDQLEEAPVDCVSSVGVLEHFEEWDGITMLKGMCKILRPGGILSLEYATPLSRSHRDNPYHLHEWDNSDVATVIEQEGMEIIDSFYLSLHKKDWPYYSPKLVRVPDNMARNVIGVLCDDTMGQDGVIAARKK